MGARVSAGRYPEPPTSRLFRNRGGRFTLAQTLTNVGLVSGACFADVTGDGRPDLILACEWGPLRLFRNEEGRLVEWNVPVTVAGRSLSLDQLRGWWNGVTSGDFDGDGRLDIVASNWGQNSWNPDFSLVPHPPRRRIWYGDLGGSSGFDLLETVFDAESGTEHPVRGLATLREHYPFILQQVDTWEAFGRATVTDLFGDRLKHASVVEASWFASTLFLNRGDHFEARPLPPEAQLAPAFGLSVADFDGDGREDLFLAQNFFATEPEAWRHDAGRGLILLGDGQGGFSPLPGSESGVIVWGEQRGCAVADYDADGRTDLVVTQNRGETRLFHNRGGKTGLRVHLNSGNSLGAGVRLKFGDGSGPLREVHAGSGYWSQDSPVLVLSTPAAATAIEVRWPGGSTTVTPVTAGARDITVQGP